MKRRKTGGLRKALAIFCFAGVAVYLSSAFLEGTPENTKILLFVFAAVFAVLGILAWPKRKRQTGGQAAEQTDLAAARVELARANAALDALEGSITVEVLSDTPPAPPADEGAGIAVLDSELQNPLRAAFDAVRLDPALIRVDLHGDSGFTLRYQSVYLGRYYRCVTPDKWAIKKPGTTRATRVFDREIDAREMVAARPEYQIEYRPGQNIHSLQYMTGLQDFEEIDNPTAEQCLFVIERWAEYARQIKDGWEKLLQP